MGWLGGPPAEKAGKPSPDARTVFLVLLPELCSKIRLFVKQNEQMKEDADSKSVEDQLFRPKQECPT